MKKLICIILASMLFGISASAYNAGMEALTELPAGWSVSRAGAGTGTAEISENALVLTAPNEASANRITVETDKFALEKGNAEIDLSFEYSGEISDRKTVALTDGNARNTVNVLAITGNSLKLFNKTASDIKPNTRYDFKMYIDTENQKAVVFDGENVFYEGDAQWAANIDFSNLYFSMLAQTAAASKSPAVLKIYSLASYETGEYAFSSTPADGEFISVKNVEKITVNFGETAAPQTLKEENFTLFENETEIPFEFSAEKDKVYITAEFKENREYKLVIKSIVNCFNEVKGTDKEISFRAVSEDYEIPKIEISDLSDREIYDGQTETIGFAAEGDIARIYVYVNGIQKDTLSASAREYAFREKSGEYTLYFAAADSLGATGQSSEVKINVLENDSPVIEFVGIKDGAVLNITDSLKITVSDTQSMSTKVYADGEEILTTNETDISISLESIGTGMHYIRVSASDEYGKVSESSISIKVVNEIEAIVSSEDFSKGIPSGYSVVEQGGFIRSETIDEEHGKSCLVGMGLPKEGQSDCAWLGIPNGGRKSLVYTMEVYMEGAMSGAYSDSIRINGRGNGSIDDNYISIGGGNISFKNPSNGASVYNFKYSEKTWYKISIGINVNNGTGSYAVCDENGTLVSEGATVLNPNLTSAPTIRIYGSRTNTAEGEKYIAIDNLEIKSSAKTPSIISASDDGKTVTAEFDEYFEDTKLEANSVSISGAEVEAAEILGGKLVVTLKNKLKYNREYMITLKKGVRFAAGFELTNDIKYKFVSALEPLSIINESLKQNGGNIVYSGCFAGSESAGATAVAILQEFKNGRIVSQTAKEINAGDFKIEKAFKGDAVRAYVWDGLSSMKLISGDILKYTSK